MDIFLKHVANTGKTDLLQMSLHPKARLKPLEWKPYTLPFNIMHDTYDENYLIWREWEQCQPPPQTLQAPL